MQAGKIYDSNSRIVADAVLELGGLPMVMGIVADDLEKLRQVVQTALAQADVVLMSGGTSKGQGTCPTEWFANAPTPESWLMASR
jgi:putative molybdopterin biosynthesis protein